MIITDEKINFNFGSLLKKIAPEPVKEQKEQPRIYQCPYCSLEFPSDIERREHKKACPEKPEPRVKKETKPELSPEVINLLTQMNAKITELTQVLEIKENKRAFNEENLIAFFQSVKYAKKYEIKRIFPETSSFEIDKMVNALFKRKILKRNKKYWYAYNDKTN